MGTGVNELWQWLQVRSLLLLPVEDALEEDAVEGKKEGSVKAFKEIEV